MAKISGLLEAGLELMEQVGKPLTKLAGRGQLYRISDGKTVRVRTCRDPQMPMARAKNSERLQIQDGDPDYLLAVMPEAKNGQIIMAFLVPMTIAIEAAETVLKDWLTTNPRRSGSNASDQIWHMPFYDYRGTGGYRQKWAQYRLEGTVQIELSKSSGADLGKRLAVVIASARRHIAAAAGVPMEAVRISIDLA